MARDPRKNSAFDSGMRGREKPKVQAAHGGTMGSEDGSKKGGESKQGANTVVGDPDGVEHTDSAYSSGMRGAEKPKQKTAAGDATMRAEDGSRMGGEDKQGPNSIVGNPSGLDTAGTGARAGVSRGAIQQSAVDAHKPGIPGNNTEEAIQGEEDDTHINVRIPKASLKKKAGGLQTS
jgi:hypothetical protein